MKDNKDDLVTKGYLSKEFDDKLKKYATKTDLNFAITDLKYELKLEMEDNYLKTRNDIMQFKDDVVSMFLELKTEISSLTSLYKRHDEKLEDHEVRLIKVEKSS